MTFISMNKLCAKTIRQLTYLTTCMALLLWATAGTAASVEVKFDVASCATPYLSCMQASPTGINEGAAAVDNHAPVLLIIKVKQSNQPVSGLVAADFNFSHIISPAGTGVVKPDPIVCPACFADRGNGNYMLAVQPSLNLTGWKAGTYFTDLEVQITPNMAVSRIVPIKIQ